MLSVLNTYGLESHFFPVRLQLLSTYDRSDFGSEFAKNVMVMQLGSS